MGQTKLKEFMSRAENDQFPEKTRLLYRRPAKCSDTSPSSSNFQALSLQDNATDELKHTEDTSAISPALEDPFEIYQGRIVTVPKVINSIKERNTVFEATQALCLEMEAAGMMDRACCLPIRGISDFADGNKNESWQPYASLAAAAVARGILDAMTPDNDRRQ